MRNRIKKNISQLNNQEIIEFDSNHLWHYNYISKNLLFLFFISLTILELLFYLFFYPPIVNKSDGVLYLLFIYELGLSYFITGSILHFCFIYRKIGFPSILKIKKNKGKIYYLAVEKRLSHINRIKIEYDKLIDKTNFRILLNYIIIPGIALCIDSLFLLMYLLLGTPFDIILIFLLIIIGYFLIFILIGIYLFIKHLYTEKNYEWIFDYIKEIEKVGK